MGTAALGRTYRHIRRYEEVLGLLVKHGFGDLLHGLGLETYLEAGLDALLLRHHPAHAESLSTAERVRLLLTELGPTFIKAGQFLSTRADLLGPEFLAELSKLQDDVPPFPFAEVRRIVEAELGAPLASVFRRFDREPVAAASIAQLHKADLLDGTKVVVKVQRPEIARTVEADLEIMAHLAALAEKHAASWKWRQPAEIVRELGHSLARELDFSIEASHMERFAREFAEEPTVRVPAVHRRWSTARILTMERMRGLKADDLAGLEREGIAPRAVARLVTRHFLRQIFSHGFFHSDPHPGNIFIQPGPVVCYLDFGQAGRVDRDTREALADLVMAVAARDEVEASQMLLRMAVRTQEPDRRLFERDVGELLDQYTYRPLREWRIGRVLQQLFETTARHRLKVPAELFLLVKTVSTLESLARTLDADFDVLRVAAPFIRRLEVERMSPRRLLADLLDAGESAYRALRDLPWDLGQLLRRLKEGRLLLEFEHKGLEPFTAALDRVSNRLSFAVVLAAMIVGSSVIVHAGIPPHWHGLPVLGVGGYLLAAAMALWLLYSILRHGRM